MNHLKIILVFVSIALGTIAGLFIEPNTSIYALVDLLGQLFINALKLVIVPLVVSSIITGIAKMGQEEKVASLGFKTFGTYFLLTTCATLCGLLAVILVTPGLREVVLTPLNPLVTEPASVGQKLGEVALKLFPPNIFQAAAEGQMLGLIVFSLLFGFFTAKVEPQLSGTLQSFWKGVFQVMMKVTEFIMKFLPIGVFALIAKVVASTGFDSIMSSGWFFSSMMLAFVFYAGIVLPLFLKFWGGVKPLKHFQAMGPALLTAFTTSSSSATLPVTLECLEKRAGVSNRIVGFTIPIGTSFHMAGTAIFECVAVIFIAQTYGIPLEMADYFLIVVLSVIMSIGIAGVPSGCVVAVIVILSMMNFPTEGIGLLFVVERLLDMLRTVMNVFSNSVSTVLIARSEREMTSLH